MTAIRSPLRHPSAGDLVRRIDGELDPRTEARLARHLDQCAACRGRLVALAERSREASRLLDVAAASIDPDEVRRRRAKVAVVAAAARRRSIVRVRRGWATAAAIAAMVVVSLTVDPLRAWVMQRLTSPGVAPSALDAPAPSLPSAVVGRDGSVIAFQPSGELFELSVEQTQEEGELLLQVRSVSEATAQVTNGGSESMLVLPSGLRIENEAGSRASYRVTLPASVERLSIRVGDGAARTVDVAGPDWAEVIPLQK
jgi:Putative zinc-finger